MKKFKFSKDLLFLFFLFLFAGLFFSSINGKFADGFWCYSFSYSMAKGFKAYVDFNMIIPIFYPLIGSLFLKIFGTGYHIFILFHTILMTLLFYLLFKLYGKKAYLFLLIVLFSYFQLIYPTYNSFLLVLFFSIIYLEKYQKSDYLIGIVIGLSIITKFNVGLFFFLPSLLYIKNFKKVFKRIVGLVIPVVLFIIYLLIQNNFREFFDLCVLGLFSFKKDNSIYLTGNSLVLIALLVYLFINIFKNRKNIYNYYALSSVMFCVPIIDMYHLFFFIFCLPIIFLDRVEIKDLYLKFVIVFAIFAFLYLFFIYYDVLDGRRFASNDDFKYYVVEKEEYKKIKALSSKYKKYDNCIIISDNYYGSFFDLYYNKRTSYLNIFFKGNYGYDEYDNIIKYIKKSKKKCFIIRKDSSVKTKQFYYEASDYIKKNSKFIESCFDYEIYLYEK